MSAPTVATGPKPRASKPDGLVRRIWQSARTPFVLLLLLAVSIIGWVARVRPLAVVWGDVATWVAGVGTILALAIAVTEFKRSTVLAREERQEAMVTEYLANAYLAVCKVAGAPGGFYTTDEVVGDLENAINAAELFGSDEVRGQARILIDGFHASKVDLVFGPLKYALRDELRQRLALSRVEGETTHLIFLTGPRFERTKASETLFAKHKEELEVLLGPKGSPD